MITFVTGVPGSGKTVYAVYKMLSDKKEIYTNIDLYSDSPIKFKKFNWEEYLEKITALYKINDDADGYIDLAKKMGIYNISIYFDECHIKLDSQKKEVVWWLSIHRHLSQDIMLITQNKGIVAQKYRLFPEIFIDAHRASLRFFTSTMKYSEYGTFAMQKKDRIRRFGHKYNKEIFTYYRTGARNKGVNTLRKRVYLLLAFALVPIFAIGLFVNSFSSTPESVSTVEKNIKLKDKKVPAPIVKEDNKILSWFECDLSQNYLQIEGWFFERRSLRVRKLMNTSHKRIFISKSYSKVYFKKDNEIVLALLDTKKFNLYQKKLK